ncbi:transthyretin family protein [Klebsiella pneumoniae]|nr:transthyretin family protein [Klebsiella pneumoniae]
MKLVIASVISLLSFSALAAPEGTLSVHILNQQTGLPSPGVQIELDKQQGESWQHIATGKTDADGRIKSLYPQAENMEPGVYKVTFKTGEALLNNRESCCFGAPALVKDACHYCE